MITFKFEVENAAGVRFAFAGLAANIQDWRKNIWTQVVEGAMKPWLRKQFESEGHGEYGKWAPLTPRYARWKAKHYPGKKILERTGAMKGDLLSPENRGVQTPRTLTYGTNILYAKFHQKGTKHMVARRIFDPELLDAPGTLRHLVRVSVARGVAIHARKLGFAILGARGEEGDAAEAALLGRQALSGGWGEKISVAEGL